MYEELIKKNTTLDQKLRKILRETVYNKKASLSINEQLANLSLMNENQQTKS